MLPALKLDGMPLTFPAAGILQAYSAIPPSVTLHVHEFTFTPCFLFYYFIAFFLRKRDVYPVKKIMAVSLCYVKPAIL